VALRPGWLGPEIQGLRGYLVIAVLAVPAMILSGFIPNVLAAAQKVRTSATLGVVINAGLTIAAVVGILTAGIAGMYVATVTALTLMVIAGLLFLRTRLKLPLVEGTTSVLTELRANPGVIGFSLIASLGAIASSVALLIMRQAVLGTSGATEAGLLQSAYALALAINMVLNPTNGLYLTPIMNRSIAEAEKLRTALEYQTRLAAILILVALPLMLFPKTALYVLFSGRFVGAGQWVFLFVTAQLVLQVAGIYQAVLIGLNALGAYAAVTVGGHLTTALLAWLLAPAWGLGGAGAALLAGAGFSAVAGLTVLSVRHGLRVSLGRFAIVAYAVVTCASV
jgi:O-antigen/teichoic acid export membrane protein